MCNKWIISCYILPWMGWWHAHLCPSTTSVPQIPTTPVTTTVPTVTPRHICPGSWDRSQRPSTPNQWRKAAWHRPENNQHPSQDIHVDVCMYTHLMDYVNILFIYIYTYTHIPHRKAWKLLSYPFFIQSRIEKSPWQKGDVGFFQCWNCHVSLGDEWNGFATSQYFADDSLDVWENMGIMGHRQVMQLESAGEMQPLWPALSFKGSK